MKYAIVTRDDEKSKKLALTFEKLARPFQLQKNEEAPDLVLTIGGDGTLLQAFHQYKHILGEVGFVGIHTGHLGFYADWDPEQLEELVHLIAKEDMDAKAVAYPLAHITMDTSSGVVETYALNEMTIKGIYHTMVAEIKLNDDLFLNFRGDGICISTPSGSTAYNKSIGGAVIHPSFNGIQIGEIASINNRVYRSLGSSFLLPQHHHCDIYPRQGQNLLVTIDHLSYNYREIHSVRCCVAEPHIRFIRYRPFTFWNRVREAFIDDDGRP
jgi:NAD+ kinase